jgi:hypothetical protein
MKTRCMIACACGLSGAALALAQTSELYLTTYGDTQAYVVQEGEVIRTFSRAAPNDGPALVVQDTIKMFGQANGGVGRQYALDGTPLAGQYPNLGFTDCYDGATDGTRNWTISHNDFGNNFAVLIGDGDWAEMDGSFVPERRSSGITYDPSDDTLWISNNVGGSDRVQHYSITGQLLGEFAVPLQSGGGYGIALDYADDTLWITGAFGTAGHLYQYSKAGQLLADVTPSGLVGNVLGAEFAMAKTTCDPCDTNCDGVVDAFDIEPFIDLLVNPNPSPCSVCSGDTNGDGVVDAFDIEPFINCLVGP